MQRYGPIYEASPWVAEAVLPRAASGELDPPGALAAAMRAVVDAASYERKLALIRSHPQLASRVSMAASSLQEQSGAGLDQCSDVEFEAFQRLNSEYLARFGFPFIIAVRGLTRGEILRAFGDRLANAPEAEFQTALVQIHRIAALRLDALA